MTEGWGSQLSRLEIHRGAGPLGVRIPRPPPYFSGICCGAFAIDLVFLSLGREVQRPGAGDGLSTGCPRSGPSAISVTDGRGFSRAPPLGMLPLIDVRARTASRDARADPAAALLVQVRELH